MGGGDVTGYPIVTVRFLDEQNVNLFIVRVKRDKRHICFAMMSIVLVPAFPPVMVFGANGAFLLILTESGGVPEAEAFKASGDHNKVFHFAQVPIKLDFS